MRQNNHQKTILRGASSPFFALLAAILLFAASSSAQAECTAEAITEMDEVGAANIFLGAPTSGHLSLIPGCARDYENGVVLWAAETGAHEVHGAIRDAYISHGGVIGELGFPTTSETMTPDTVGRYNHFENGSLYYFPWANAYLVKGLIRHKWATMGWENSILGYPLSDELTTPDGVGRFNFFQYGAIYYHPIYGTFYLRGPILDQWLQGGAELGPMGYPVSDPICHGHNCSQQFEHGDLTSDVDNVDLRHAIDDFKGMPMEDQAGRNTCSVMSMTVILQYGYTELCGAQTPFADLSEEYLNHVTNDLPVNDGHRDGDIFERIANGYEADGMIWETEWPFRTGITHTDYDDNDIFSDDVAAFDPDWTALGESMLISGLHQDGHFIQPGDGDTISDFEFDEVLMYLRAGIPVAMGREHSQVAVGYIANNGAAGGGTMIMRDSYGTGSAWGGYSGGYNGYSFDEMKNGVPAKGLSGVFDSYVYRRRMNTSITYGPVSVNAMAFDYVLYGSDTVYLNDRADIWADSPALAKIVAGDAQSTDAVVNIGVDAQCYDIMSRGNTTLRSARVYGDVETQIINRQWGTYVEGATTTGDVEPFQILRGDPQFFDGMFDNATDHFVENGQTFVMNPGEMYGNIFVRDGGNLVMSGVGEFYARQLHVDAGGNVDMPASRQMQRSVLYTPNSLTFSPRARISGNPRYMLWVTMGSNVYLGPEVVFGGTVLAPNAYINVDGRNGQISGAFMGRSVTVHQDANVSHIPFWF